MAGKAGNIFWVFCSNRRGRFVHPRCRGRTRRYCSPRLWPNRCLKFEHSSCLLNRGGRKHLRRISTPGLRTRPPRETRERRTTSRMAYADQRINWRLNARLEASALHIGPPPEDNEKSDWATCAAEGYRLNCGNRILLNRSPRHASGRSTGKQATCHTC